MRPINKAFWIFGLWILLSSAALAQKSPDPAKSISDILAGKSYKLGLVAVSEKKWPQALKIFTALAKKNYAPALFRLGELYHRGRGVKIDHKKAIRYYTKSAVRGYARAQNNLGIVYRRGDIVKQNYVKAAYWFRKAAPNNDAAMNNLALAHRYGQGVKKSNVEAVRLLQIGIKNKYAKSVFVMERLYEKGRGVKKDFQEAMKLYRWAAILKYDRALYVMGEIYRKGRGEVDVSFVKAERWYQYAINKDYRSGFYGMGLLLLTGKDDFKRNPTEALRMLKMASERGHRKAPLEIGKMHAAGNGIKKNIKMAKRWFRLAIKRGDPAAKILLKRLDES